MGDETVSALERAFYARRGSPAADVVTILHLPYTAWHLSYVVIGAALAPRLDWLRLAGTLVAFAAGLGVAAHALDEVHDRPLGTSLADRTLWALGMGGLAVAAGVAVAGAFVISPLVLMWAAAGVLLALSYSLEWSSLIHSDLGFGLAWGAFPLLVGYWAQAETLGIPALMGAAAATGLSLVQRSLSNSAKRLRRHPTPDLTPARRQELLRTWETPLRYLSITIPLLALVMALIHL